MGYKLKWINDNLGITRDMIRHYEKAKLLSCTKNRDANNVRDYTEEDVEKIWGIKLLIGIGFSTKEIKAMMEDSNYDFNTAIELKIKELEQKHDENLIYLEFAKSIKLIGRVPNTSKIGNMKFDEFLSYARENWNFFDDPKSAPFMKSVDTLIKPVENWNQEDYDRVIELINNFNQEEMMHTFTLNGYYQVISDMQELGYSSDIVQRVVRLLHEYLVKHNTNPELDGKITPQFLAKYTAPFFIDGDIAIIQEKNFGKEGCLFIANALAYYGGYDIDEL